MSEYYDGTKLLSMKDINGETPELYLCVTNRTAGKTTYFGRLLVNRFLKSGRKFVILYRFAYEMSGVSDKFFKDLRSLFFPQYNMTDKSMANGAYREIFLQKEKETPTTCGYAVALNNADQIKKFSHLFSDVDSILFDEFQSETNHYCSREIEKLVSIHTSIARGQGKQTRPVPVYMLSNAVSLINPYYVELGISDRLQENTKFLRGDGFVLENGYVESAATALKESPFNRAFSNNNYIAYSSQNVYLNDNMAFVDRPSGKSSYIATISYEGKQFGLREYLDEGIVYCDTSFDETYPFRIAVTTEDHRINYVMLNRNSDFVHNMRYYFERGCFRFKNLLCKDAVLKLISY